MSYVTHLERDHDAKPNMWRIVPFLEPCHCSFAMLKPEPNLDFYKEESSASEDDSSSETASASDADHTDKDIQLTFSTERTFSAGCLRCNPLPRWVVWDGESDTGQLIEGDESIWTRQRCMIRDEQWRFNDQVTVSLESEGRIEMLPQVSGEHPIYGRGV